jgi:hypothetical protein
MTDSRMTSCSRYVRRSGRCHNDHEFGWANIDLNWMGEGSQLCVRQSPKLIVQVRLRQIIHRGILPPSASTSLGCAGGVQTAGAPLAYLGSWTAVGIMNIDDGTSDDHHERRLDRKRQGAIPRG